MKRVLFLCGLLLLISNITAYAANHMDTYSWSWQTITIEQADKTPPYVIEVYPENGTVGNDINLKPSCRVKDDLSGVDINTIVMKVNGTEVTVEILGDKNDYLVVGNPGILSWDTIYHVTINASDLAAN